MNFSKRRTQLQHLLFEVQSSATIRQPKMYKCPSCAAEVQQGSPYCGACGRVFKVSAGPSYGAAWMFAMVGLLVVGLYWAAIITSQEAKHATQTPTPTLDASARLIQQCGKPEGQNSIPAKPQTRQSERLVLSYRTARVKAVFERDTPQSSDGWKNVKYFDPATGKPMNSQQIMKRLPCAVSVTNPQGRK
jgi:hypothetical protein